MDFRESFFKITLLSSSSLYSLSIQRFSTFKLQINPPFLSPPVEIRYLRCLYVVGSYRSAQCFKKACKLLSTKPRASPQYLFIFLQVGVVCLSSIQFSLIFSQWVSHGVVWVEDFLTQIPH